MNEAPSTVGERMKAAAAEARVRADIRRRKKQPYTDMLRAAERLEEASEALADAEPGEERTADYYDALEAAVGKAKKEHEVAYSLRQAAAAAGEIEGTRTARAAVSWARSAVSWARSAEKAGEDGGATEEARAIAAPVPAALEKRLAEIAEEDAEGGRRSVEEGQFWQFCDAMRSRMDKAGEALYAEEGSGKYSPALCLPGAEKLAAVASDETVDPAVALACAQAAIDLADAAGEGGSKTEATLVIKNAWDVIRDRLSEKG